MQYILLNWEQMFILYKIPWKLTFKDFIYKPEKNDVNNQSLSVIILLI